MNQTEMSLANDRQVGGNHYKRHILEHWDTVILFNLDYFQASIWKYVLRWRDKNGIQDLEKSGHYIQKYIEVEKARADGTLTRQILERAIRELEGIECMDEHAAMYRAQAKGDDPVGDALSGYPFKVLTDDTPLETSEAEAVEGVVRGSPLEREILRAQKTVAAWPEDVKQAMGVGHRGCTHGADDCPVHPNGGCPPTAHRQKCSPNAAVCPVHPNGACRVPP